MMCSGYAFKVVGFPVVLQFPPTSKITNANIKNICENVFVNSMNFWVNHV